VVVGADGSLPLPWLQVPLRQALQQQRAHALLLQAEQGIGALEFLLTLAQAWLCESTDAAPALRAMRQLPAAAVGLAPGPAPSDARIAARLVRWRGPGRRRNGRRSQGAQEAQPADPHRRGASCDRLGGAVVVRGQAKVVLLHPAEAMNLQAASALLKTLEEPPGQARLLLSTADEARLLPTVRSRCQRIRLAGPPAEQATAWLEEQGVRDAPVLLAAAGGAPLAARELAAAGIDAAAWLDLPRAMARGQAAALAGWPVPRAVDALQKLCHDAQVVSVGGAPRYFAVQALPPGARPGPLIAWAKSLARVARHDEHPWNDGLLVEALVSEGRACWQEARLAAPAGAGPWIHWLDERPRLTPHRHPGCGGRCRAGSRRCRRGAAQRDPTGLSGERCALRGLHSAAHRRRSVRATAREYRLGEDIYLLLSLPDDPQRYPVAGKVAWITPSNASGGRTQGVGVRFPPTRRHAR